MKRTLSFMVMALALLLTQCRKPEVKFPTPSSAEGVTVSMTVTAGPGSKTDITTAGAITWSSGDKLYVGYNGAYVGYLTLTSGQNTPTGWFSGNVTLPNGTTDGEKTFGFFYLGSDNSVAPAAVGATSVNVLFNEQNIYNNGGKLENAKKFHVGYGSAQGTVAGSEVTGINVTLVSKVALARFSFKKGDAAYDGALTLSGDHIYSSMTVGFNGEFNHGATAGNITLTAGHSERYVMLVPVGTGSETLSFAGDGFEGPTTLGSGIEANKFYGRETAIVVNLTKVPVPVTGVTVAPTELNLVAGGTSTLTATVTPENADDKSVTWSSSDPGVATVSDGLVTAVAEGSATITVTTVDGSKTATCAVTVTAPAPTTHVFTVAAGTTVEFSPGNLYWDGSAFRFEENQWSFASTWNEKHVSHFYWSKTESVAYALDYSDGSALAGDVFFTNGNETTANSHFQVEGEEAGTWRTLSIGEWDYLLNKWGSNGRSDVNRFAKAKVNYVNGLLIFPDGYNGDEPVSGITGIAEVNNSSAAFPTDNIPTDTWTSMGLQGVVFLPAAGYRGGGKPGPDEPIIIDPIRAAGGGSDISDTDSGYYWSSSWAGPGGGMATGLGITENYIATTANDVFRKNGYSVRLVK